MRLLVKVATALLALFIAGLAVIAAWVMVMVSSLASMLVTIGTVAFVVYAVIGSIIYSWNQQRKANKPEK